MQLLLTSLAASRPFGRIPQRAMERAARCGMCLKGHARFEGGTGSRVEAIAPRVTCLLCLIVLAYPEVVTLSTVLPRLPRGAKLLLKASGAGLGPKNFKVTMRSTIASMNWVSLQPSRPGSRRQTSRSDAWNLGRCCVMGSGSSSFGQVNPCARMLRESLHKT